MSYTKGTWRKGIYGSIVTDTPIKGNGEDSIRHYGGNCVCESINDENARRILAEHKACAGITTEALEAGIVCMSIHDWAISCTNNGRNPDSVMGMKVLEESDGK